MMFSLALTCVARLLATCGTDHQVLPATALYNEGWLLRIILDWFSQQYPTSDPLSFSDGSRWFSEGLLTSQFRPRYGGDKLAEGWTHADGVIGHIEVGGLGHADIRVNSSATHLVVTEAKLFSPLASGVKNAPYFDQAARSVACIAELLRDAGRPPDGFSNLGFYVLAPREQIEAGLFSEEVTPSSIQEKVARRVKEYRSEKDSWLHEWFEPTLKSLDIRCLMWEELITHIRSHDAQAGQELEEFYQGCLEFNQPAADLQDMEPLPPESGPKETAAADG